MKGSLRLSVHLLIPVSIACAGCSLLPGAATAPDANVPLPPRASRPTVHAGQSPTNPPLPTTDESDSGFSWGSLNPKNTSDNVKKLIGQGPDRQVARQHFQEAEAVFRRAKAMHEAGEEGSQDDFEDAADTYTKAASRWPDSALEQDALFMAGQSFFFADQLPKANDQFDLLLKKYPNSRHLDMVGVLKFKIAKYLLDAHRAKPQSALAYNFTDSTRPGKGTFGYAVKMLDKMRLDDPTGRLADDATMLVGNAFFERGKYIDAGERFEDLIRTFPNSEHQFTAHLFALKAKLESYQGANYDADPLSRAERLLKQIRKQFPHEADEHREYLRRVHAEIRFRLAEREMRTASYYDRRGAYGAARYHYDILVADYTDTPFGEDAYERLAKIQTKPANPPERLSWFTKIFPDAAPAKPLIPSGTLGPILR